MVRRYLFFIGKYAVLRVPAFSELLRVPAMSEIDFHAELVIIKQANPGKGSIKSLRKKTDHDGE